MGDDIERGFQLLDEGKIDEARRLGDRAVTAEPDSAEAHTLVGAVAHAEGDDETAGTELERAMELDPEWVTPILIAIESAAASGDFAAARKLCERALDVADEEEDYLEALLLKAEVQLGADDHDGARATLAELPPVALPNVELSLRAAECFLELEDLDGAARHYQQALDEDPESSDALYGLGLVAEERDDRAAMLTYFARVRTLDAALPAPDNALSTERLEELVEQALNSLPEKARELLREVPIMVEELPSEELVADGFDPRGLGLFAGVPYPEQSTLSGQPPHLECIFLFQRNIERVARTAEEVENELRITLLHETAHFFGLDDAALADLGLD